jgi:hypothetical protein
MMPPMRTALALVLPLLVLAPSCYVQARDDAALRQQILELIRQEQQRQAQLAQQCNELRIALINRGMPLEQATSAYNDCLAGK